MVSASAFQAGDVSSILITCSKFKTNNMNIQNYFIDFKNIFLTTSRKCKSHESVNNVREGGYQGSR